MLLLKAYISFSITPQGCQVWQNEHLQYCSKLGLPQNQVALANLFSRSTCCSDLSDISILFSDNYLAQSKELDIFQEARPRNFLGVNILLYGPHKDRCTSHQHRAQWPSTATHRSQRTVLAFQKPSSCISLPGATLLPLTRENIVLTSSTTSYFCFLVIYIMESCRMYSFFGFFEVVLCL